MNWKSAVVYSVLGLWVGFVVWAIANIGVLGEAGTWVEPYIVARLGHNRAYLEYGAARRRYEDWTYREGMGLRQRQFQEALAYRDPSIIEDRWSHADTLRSLARALIAAWGPSSERLEPANRTRVGALKAILLWERNVHDVRFEHFFDYTSHSKLAVLNDEDRLAKLLSGDVHAVDSTLPVKPLEVVQFEAQQKHPPQAGSLEALAITHWILDSFFFALVYFIVGLLLRWDERDKPMNEKTWSRPFAGSPQAWNLISVLLPGFIVVRLLNFFFVSWRLHQLTD